MTEIIITPIIIGVIQFKGVEHITGFRTDQGHGAETSQSLTGVSRDLHTFKGR